MIVPLAMAVVAVDIVGIPDLPAEHHVTTAAAVDILLENVVNRTRLAIHAGSLATSAEIAHKEVVAAAPIGR